MKYLSVCSGIEAATVAWDSLGWESVGFSEIEKFPSAVLAHHYPNVANLGDMTKYKEWSIERPNLLVGGTPCQSFSVAGLRKGLDDPRGNLALTFIGMAERFRPDWIVWENVPGVLSSNGGADFKAFLDGMAAIGYFGAYRVLDAQFFGVPQRRRRVFAVFHIRDWRRAAAVLFEPDSLRGHSPKSREARQDAADGLGIGAGGASGDRVVETIDGKSVSHTLKAEGHDASEDGTGRGTPIIADKNKKWPADVAATLNSSFVSKQGLEDQHALGGASWFVPAVTGPLTAGMSKGPRGTEAFDSGHVIAPKAYGLPGNWIGRKPENGGNATAPFVELAPCQTKTDRHAVAVAIRGREGGAAAEMGGEVANTLRASQGGSDKPFCLSAGTVRRLTPTECERLQGFPDGYTDIKPKGKQTPDGPRYKALGNSMAVPVMAWIGERIALADAIMQNEGE